MKKKTADKTFILIVVAIVVVGFLTFLSAASSLLANDQEQFYRIVTHQAFLGLLGGSIMAFIFSHIHFNFWKRGSLYFFLAAIAVMFLAFLPNLGFDHGGARRWISIGSLSFQPVEILKLTLIIYYSAFLAWAHQRGKLKNWIFAVGSFFGILFLPFIALGLQPDFGNVIVIGMTAFGMLFLAGAKWRYIIGLIIAGTALVFALVTWVPYVEDRFETFRDPSLDPKGASWQIQNSLITIGSGEIWGRGFGQSVQKFTGYLPETIGDSIFAVYAEEVGFAGSLVLIGLFIAFVLRGFRIARLAPNQFSRLLVSGIVIMIAFQSFINIAAMLNLMPLTGIPLVFVSHGGTSLMVNLAAVGIILNISRYKTKRLS